MTEIKITPASTEKIAILGNGAIGQLLFHQLSHSGLKILMLTKPDTDELPKTLSYTDLHNINRSQAASFHSISNQTARLAALSLVIVCVKAYQVIDALTPWLPIISRRCHILLLHNGMGPHLTLAPLLENRGLTLATTSQGSLRQSKWHIKQTGAGITQLGHYCGSTLPKNLQQLLLTYIPDSLWVQQIVPALWEKLAINAVINPLTAINDCQNGELQKKQYQPIILNIAKEVVTVANADNIALTLERVIERIYQVIALTSNNYSSMHQDINKKQMTEIDAINGYIVKRAAKHHLLVPANKLLVQKITTLSDND